MSKPSPLPRPGAFALVVCELFLVLLVVYRFEVAAAQHFFPVLCLAAGGFVVHAWLPRPARVWFFTLLSLAGILLVLGWPNGGWVIGIGGGLIALCRLPLPLGLRVALLVAAGAQLAALRADMRAPFWPVLASMFMFRLIVYVFETRHERGRPPLGHTLAYFFPLPNVCFTLFPVLDFKTFRATYYDEEDSAIYQTGVAWLVRGVGHLLAYRVVNYYVRPEPFQLRDWPHLALYLAANYALYLRVSGWFHIATGLLHLFGFNLPRTHLHYFLASGFSDLWRRINIYWKDFMTNVFFYPAFFTLRPLGTRLALAGASLGVFAATWLLHSYQTFWLIREAAFSAKDAYLWLGAGVLVTVNLLFDLRRAKKAPTAGEAWPGLWGALWLSLRTVAMFCLVSLFWGAWSVQPQVLPALVRVPASFDPPWTAGAFALLAILAGVVAAGVVVQWVRAGLLRRGVLPVRPSFAGSVAWHAAALALLAGATVPQAADWLGPSGGEVVENLRRDARTPVEVAQVVRGYYEEIAEAHVQAGPWLDVLSGKEEPPALGGMQYSEITRPVPDDLVERELIPGWKGAVGGKQLTINSQGLRDREGIDPHKPAGTCRVALVGSSVVMGYGVGDDEVFKVLLEDRLNAAARPGGPHYELVNFGTGMSDAIHRRVLIERKVFGFGPDALYYFAHQDEFLMPPRHLARLVARGTPLPYPSLADVVRRAGITPDTPWGVTSNRLQPFGRDIAVGLYRGLVRECRERGVLPVWVYLPVPGVVQVRARAADLVGAAAEAGFVTLNLEDWPGGHAPAEVKLGEKDYHANALGHRLIAGRLFEALRARPELLPEFARLPAR
jgi:hypothetical protein